MLSSNYMGSVCEVKTIKNQLIATGRVQRVYDDTLEITDYPNTMPIISLATPLKITVFNNEFGMKVLIGEAYISNRQLLRAVNVVDFIEFERRSFFRVELEQPASIIMENSPNQTGAFWDDSMVEIAVVIKDISLSGLLFVSDEHECKIGELYKVRMVLGGREQHLIPVVIKRLQQVPGSLIGYGASFIGLSDHMEQILCAYLFQKQREQIRRARQLEY